MSAPLRDWLTLHPVGSLGIRLGSTLWIGLPILIVLCAGLYWLVVRVLPGMDAPMTARRAHLMRYARMVVSVLVALFAGGLVSGIGVQVGLALYGVLGGILGNILGTLAELLGLLLPIFGGLAVVYVLGTLLSELLGALLERFDSALLQRGLGLVLGALAGGLLFYLIYAGVNEFYTPGEPAPYVGWVALAGAILGGALGALVGANHPVPSGLVVYYVTRTILNVLRSIEPLIMAIVFAIWVGIGPFAGVLALTLHSIAALAKLYSEQVESIDPGPIEAITATGATRLQTIVYGVIPQIVPPFLSFTIYRWDINVRMSTIIGFVGGGGIGTLLKQWIDLLQYDQAGVATLAIAIVVATLDYVSAKTREKIV
jgi:phosphonate ABC transporter permease subunit PhnE